MDVVVAAVTLKNTISKPKYLLQVTNTDLEGQDIDIAFCCLYWFLQWEHVVGVVQRIRRARHLILVIVFAKYLKVKLG